MTDPTFLRADGPRLLLAVHAAPRAARTRLAGVHGGRLKVQLAAPPVEGAANRELVRFLARRLGVPPSAVTLVQGASSRHKTVAVAGLTLDEARARLGDGG